MSLRCACAQSPLFIACHRFLKVYHEPSELEESTAGSSCTVTGQDHMTGVTTEAGNMLLDPLQCFALIFEAIVQAAAVVEHFLTR